MGSENQNVMSVEYEKKGLTLKDILYVLKKYIIIEVAILLVAIIVGGFFCITSKPLYVATVDLSVEISNNSDAESKKSIYNDTTLTHLQLPKMARLMKEEIVIISADNNYKKKKQIPDDGKFYVNASSCSVHYEEDVSILSVSYRDYDAIAASEKLDQVVLAFEDVCFSSPEVIIAGGSITVKDLRFDPKVPVAAVRTSSNSMKMLVAGIAGVLLAVLTAFAFYFIGDKINSVERIESITGKKNMVIIREEKRKGKKQDFNELVYMNVDKLADSLVYLHSDEEKKVYQIQSAVHGEGKSSVSCNLARSLGLLGKRTIVLECDFRKPAIYRYFNLKRHGGLTDYCKDKLSLADAIKQTEYDNVEVITCGERIENHAVLLMSQKFQNLIAELKKKYDFVILDCAPVQLVSDYISISRLVDSTVLVVGSDRVSSQQLKSTVSDLATSGTEIVGTVFNHAERLRKRSYYYYYTNKNELASEKTLEYAENVAKNSQD